MKKRILTILSFALCIFLNECKVLGQKANPEQSNVIWDSPSKNSSGSMPLGNGETGLNVWVEETILRIWVDANQSVIHNEGEFRDSKLTSLKVTPQITKC